MIVLTATDYRRLRAEPLCWDYIETASSVVSGLGVRPGSTAQIRSENTEEYNTQYSSSPRNYNIAFGALLELALKIIRNLLKQDNKSDLN